MNPAEQVEVLRRIGEQGLKYSQDYIASQEDSDRSVDLWQHLLDELERLQKCLP